MSAIKITLVQKKAIPNNKNRNLELAVQYIKKPEAYTDLVSFEVRKNLYTE